MRAFRHQRLWVVGLLVWLGMIACGYGWLLRYGFAPGKTATAPPSLPPSLGPAKATGRAQLFVALHPRCPCSRATLRELEKILSHPPQAWDVTVLMYKPAEQSDQWMEGALAEKCRRMKCRIVPDPDGTLAASLGSLTSGAVAVYGADGTLRYQGGITASRGHEGDNAGETAVIEILQGSTATHKTMPVFGCPIQEAAAR